MGTIHFISKLLGFHKLSLDKKWTLSKRHKCFNINFDSKIFTSFDHSVANFLMVNLLFIETQSDRHIESFRLHLEPANISVVTAASCRRIFLSIQKLSKASAQLCIQIICANSKKIFKIIEKLSAISEALKNMLHLS